MRHGRGGAVLALGRRRWWRGCDGRSEVQWGGRGGTGEGAQAKGRWLVPGAQQEREGSVDRELTPASGEGTLEQTPQGRTQIS